ncbi:MAG: pyridoxamine 5'-phosphate oxidase family protein [Candidatus Accumulibacter sp.]|jgi:hypothetical protein|nr:pyridoxamine 5'-phosphate oxidase family protein [Accumulibacter sp.]
MSAILSSEIIELLNSAETVKVLASVDIQGVPHAVIKGSLHAAEDGKIHLLERFEASTSGRNLTASLWFDRRVAILLFDRDGRKAIQIKGKPLKCHISGPLFLRHYAEIRKRPDNGSLAGVWVIEPEEVIDESFAERKAREQSEHPVFTHLDLIAKPLEKTAA